MNLESQVTSFESSKKLKELGVKQESLFYWKECDKSGTMCLLCEAFRHQNEGIFGTDNLSMNDNYSAYTASELGEYLKRFKFVIGHIYKDKCCMSIYLDYSLEKIRLIHSYDAGFSSSSEVLFSVEEDTEANLRAKMLIHLIENKLVEV